MRHPRRWLQLGLLLIVAWLTGCASQPTTRKLPLEEETHWQGKLSLKVYTTPVQAIAANFDLQGRPDKGELTLASPLGTTLARMQWDTDLATLTANGEQQYFSSLQELVRKATGSDLPVASLFAWLQGREQATPGWQVDLTDLPNGRIQAHHIEAVEAVLKIVLER
jgi:outer membrane lipoprotein LolB